MVILKNKETGERMTYSCSKKSIAELALANIEMILQIALADPDQHIDEHFDGEKGLLDCVERYMEIYDWATEDEVDNE